MTNKPRSSRKRRVTPPSVSPQEYKEFLRGVELANIRLAHSHVLAPIIYSGGDDGGLEARIATSAEYFVIPAGFVVSHTLAFSGSRQGNDDIAVEIYAELELIYVSSGTMTNELFEIFRDQNLPLNTWPYFREYLQSTLTRVGWPVYTLAAFKAWTGNPQSVSEVVEPAPIFE